jgi:hypothetical protein
LITPEDIDALLAAEKRLAGNPRWVASRETTVRIRVPLEVGGEIVGGLFVAGTASVENRPQDGSLVLLFHDQPIERFNVFPTGAHANPFKGVARRLRGLTLAAGAHRYYPWSLNRRWPRPAGDNMPVAEPVGETLENFVAALHYFLERTRIAGGLPAPPHEPRLAL